MKFGILILTFFVIITSSYSQFIEEALRYGNYNSYITPRAGSLGVSYNGIIDDAAAAFYNPAGLGLIKKNEFSVSFGFTNNNTKASFLNETDDFNTNSAHINHFSILAPFKWDDIESTVSLSYFMENDFDNTVTVSAFNEKSTFIKSEANYGPREQADNFAYELYLADNIGSPSNGTFITPFNDSLYQNAFTKESGGLHNLSLGFGFDLDQFFNFGLNIIGKWGSYNYNREFIENDQFNLYNNSPIDNHIFKSLKSNENLTQDVAGFSASLGMLVKFQDLFRLSANIKLPTWYNVEENFEAKYTATYKDLSTRSISFGENGKGNNTYSLKTPFVYSLGMSIHEFGLTLTSGLEYTDVSQLKFEDALPQVMELNMEITKELIGQINWGFGLEYEIPALPISVRASYSKMTTPYQNDIENSETNILGFGASIYAGKSLRIDLMARTVNYSNLRTLYYEENQDLARYTVENSPLTISLGLSYRY